MAQTTGEMPGSHMEEPKTSASVSGTQNMGDVFRATAGQHATQPQVSPAITTGKMPGEENEQEASRGTGKMPGE